MIRPLASIRMRPRRRAKILGRNRRNIRDDLTCGALRSLRPAVRRKAFCGPTRAHAKPIFFVFTCDRNASSRGLQTYVWLFCTRIEPGHARSTRCARLLIAIALYVPELLLFLKLRRFGTRLAKYLMATTLLIVIESNRSGRGPGSLERKTGAFGLVCEANAHRKIADFRL